MIICNKCKGITDSGHSLMVINHGGYEELDDVNGYWCPKCKRFLHFSDEYSILKQKDFQDKGD
jgi:hypothetical protein